jgi:hypothetical protein
MKFYFQLGLVCCVIALSIGAFAGSVTTVDDPAAVSSMPDTQVQGTLSYLAATGSFTGEPGYAPSLNVVLNVESGSDSYAYGFAQPISSAGGHQPVPEGGTQLSYLAGSGLVLFAGMFLANKQRRPLPAK